MVSFRFEKMKKRMIAVQAVFDSAHMRSNFALICYLQSPYCDLPGSIFCCCLCVLGPVWMYGLSNARYFLTVAFGVWKLQLWLKICIFVHAY